MTQEGRNLLLRVELHCARSWAEAMYDATEPLPLRPGLEIANYLWLGTPAWKQSRLKDAKDWKAALCTVSLLIRGLAFPAEAMISAVEEKVTHV